MKSLKIISIATALILASTASAFAFDRQPESDVPTIKKCRVASKKNEAPKCKRTVKGRVSKYQTRKNPKQALNRGGASR